MTPTAHCLIQSLQEALGSLYLDARNMKRWKEELLRQLDEVEIFDQRWNEIEKFVRNLDHDVNLAGVESFLGHSFDELTQFNEENVKEI